LDLDRATGRRSTLHAGVGHLFCRAYEKKYHWDMSELREPFFIVRPVVAFAVTETSGEHTFIGSATRWTWDSSE